MRGRSAALAIAGVLLLAGMVALRCSLASSDEEAATPPPRTAASGAPTASTPLPSAPSAPSAPAAPAATAPTPSGPAPTAAPNAPELPAIAQAFVPTEKHPPIANNRLLRDQIAAVRPQVEACAKDAGSAANGTAVLTYMVTPDKKKQQVNIEQTGVEYDGTTITDQPLLDCLKDTAKDMKFTYVPDADGVFAFRRVKLENGKLVENAYMTFHYMR
ncbi:MAG: hypothetical protein JO257_02850 [Deltaproteobacteria bacterium]|nr:hypothetical protein [Deltaproteobacteria bacterium]